MFFRNFSLFRFSAALDLSDLGARLAACALKPVGPLELSARGFIPPLGQYAEGHARTVAWGRGPHAYSAICVAVGGEDKILPGAVVNDLLQKKLAAVEEQEGRRPGARTRRRIKDQLVFELLPRAFVRPSRVDAMLLPELGVVAVDTASRAAAEAVVSEIRRALGSFPALPLNAEVAPRSVLTGWLAGEPLPAGLSLGNACELRDPADSGAVVKITSMELQGEEVAKHLEAGKQCTRLALTLDDHASFVIGEDLLVRKFKLLDAAVEQLESTDREDIAAELEARFALVAGEFTRLFAVLEKAFTLGKAD